LGFKEVIASGLETSAALLADTEHVALAARLTGAADAIREDINLTQTPAERRVHYRMHATLRASLGEHAVEDLREAGRELDVADAIELALGAMD
jgi:hypothetical protein